MITRLNLVLADLHGRLLSLARREDGQTFVEYALVLVLVAVAAVALTQWEAFVTAIGDALQKVIDVL